MYAGFMPNARELDDLWRYASQNGLPVLLHTGTTFIDVARLDCTLPRLLDDVATRFPEVRMILAHLGHPYEGETVAVIRKHPNVYADCSALYYRPFQLYHSLMLVQEYGVWDKVLFGSDYPFGTVDERKPSRYTVAQFHARRYTSASVGSRPDRNDVHTQYAGNTGHRKVAPAPIESTQLDRKFCLLPS